MEEIFKNNLETDSNIWGNLIYGGAIVFTKIARSWAIPGGMLLCNII